LSLAEFTLWNLIEEVSRRLETGRSCFAALLKWLDLPPPESSVLETVLPLSEG